MDGWTKGATDKQEDKASESHQFAIKNHQKLERAVDGRACTSNIEFRLSPFAPAIKICSPIKYAT